jgi:hypothetical protein
MNLLQYFQLQDKSVRDISRDMWSFQLYVNIFVTGFHIISQDAKRCFAEPCLRNTAVRNTPCS